MRLMKNKIFVLIFILIYSSSILAIEPLFMSKQITSENASEYVQGGPDATGGVNDWIISNGTLCVVVAGLNHEGDFSSKGGTLRDIGFCDRDDDQFVSGQDLLNGSLNEPVEITNIEAHTNQSSAWLVTIGNFNGLMVETKYVLSQEIPDRLEVKKRIWRKDIKAADGGIFSTAVLNFKSLNPFLLSTKFPHLSNGFKLEKFVGRSELSYPKTAKPIDMVIMSSPHDSDLPISYGWRRISSSLHENNEVTPLHSFVFADDTALAFITLTEDFIFGDGKKLGLLQLLQVIFMGIDLNSYLNIEEEIWVTKSSDISSITDKLFSSAPVLKGFINSHDLKTRVHIDYIDGTPYSMITPDKEGNFAAKAPQGNYHLRVLSESSPTFKQEIEVFKDGTTLEPIDLPKISRIELPTGNSMRLAFRGFNGTLNPHFEETLLGNVVNGEDGPIIEPKVSDVHLSGSIYDDKYIFLPQGDYKVYATKGPEFSVETVTLKVNAGMNQSLKIDAPKRVLSTPKHIAVDMHVHSAPSMDNAFSSRKRVKTFIAEHGEVMVAAEHDTIFDFNPLIDEMGVSGKMIAIAGTEVTSTVNSEIAPFTIGHMNFFPLKIDPFAYRKGVTPHEGKRTREVLYEMSLAHNSPIAQLNHPREGFELSGKDIPSDYKNLIQDEAFFEHMGVAQHPYNPHKKITSFPNSSLIEIDGLTGKKDIDFDVIEVMNGTQDYKPDRTAAVRQDWFSLLNQGIKMAASANSDSHNKWQQVALPRNMVKVDDDSLSAFDLINFTSSIRKGFFYGTTGPFIELNLDQSEMGEMHEGNIARLHGRIYSAEWAKANLLKVQINGEEIIQLELNESGIFSIPLKFIKDSYVTIEVIGKANEIYQAIYPGFYPYAFSNPIYVDANKDGIWTEPGLINN